MLPFILVAFAGAAGFAAAARFARMGGIAPFSGLADAEIGVVSLALALAVVSLGAVASERRLKRRIREAAEAAARFEEAASRGLGDLSNRLDKLAADSQEMPARETAPVPAYAASSAPRTAFRPAAAEPRNNVFPIEAARHKTESVSPDEIRRALAEGNLAALYQPVIALPSRRTRILDCQPHLKVGGREIEPDVWQGLAENTPGLPAADHAMMLDNIRLLRELKRTDKPGRTLCRLSRETVGNSEIWNEISGLLRANQAYAPYLYVEIRLADLTAMTTAELDRLHELREMRCLLSLDCGEGCGKLPGLLPANLFSLVRCTAASMLEPSGGGRLAIDRLRAAVSADTEMAATRVSTEEQVIALIDHDVLLAQGPLIGPAKALRHQIAGE